jgi:hypothetical protein
MVSFSWSQLQRDWKGMTGLVWRFSAVLMLLTEGLCTGMCVVLLPYDVLLYRSNREVFCTVQVLVQHVVQVRCTFRSIFC